ncbi:MAG: EAL domain-containing protein [Rhodocyclaceae bacterium]
MDRLRPDTVPFAVMAIPELEQLFGEPAPLVAERGTARVLVVEDDPLLGESLIHLLTEPDRSFEHASTVSEAISILNAREFELVLLDYRLPDATGLSVMEWLSQAGRSEAVIIVSGENSADAAIGGLRRGADDYLQKPYHPDQMRRAVDNALRKVELERTNQRMRHQLEDSGRLHRHLIEHSPDLIYTLTPDGRFAYINLRVETLLGFRRDDVVGQHYEQILWPDELAQSRDAFCERRTGARASANVELRLKRNPDTTESAEAPYVTVMLNAMGMYSRSKEAISQKPRFLGTYGVARDISDRKRAEEMIAYQAYHDQLTLLPNRALFQDRLELAVAQAQRRGATLGVMFIDLDRFKLVNDSFGHTEGDKLLRAIASRLKQCLRRGDTLARQGGDEFTALLPDLSSPDDAAIIANKILHELRAPFPVAHTEFRATVSIGIALYPRDGTSAEALTQHADIAMYQIKSRGRNNACFFSAEMNVEHMQRVTMERELARAIEQGELELEYQPKYSLSRRRMVGVEALLRWRHPERGVIPPGDFIGIAEESGLILPISDWVLNEACAQLARWRAMGHEQLQLAVNLSPRDFDRDTIVSDVVSATERHALPPSSLDIEITESSLLRDTEGVARKVRQLRKQGYGVSIDDFGTGFSSLAYLQKLPVTSLKIDRSFVQELDGGNNRHPIVSAIAGVAHGFGLHVIAEGVETEQQVYALRAMGCDEMQGYYFGRPLSPAAITAKLEQTVAAPSIFHA